MKATYVYSKNQMQYKIIKTVVMKVTKSNLVMNTFFCF